MRYVFRLQFWVMIGLSLLLATGRRAGAEGGPALPQWEESDVGALGSGLWPDDFNPTQIIHPASVSLGEGDKGSAQAEDDSWLRFLPRGLFSNRRQQPAPEPVLADFPPEALRASENASGDTRVLDPQGILAEAQTEDLTRFLASHAERASVEARLLLLDSHQQLAPGTDLSRIASGELAGGSACLVVYPLGAPQRARLFLTRNVTKAVELRYLESVAAACRREAAEAPDPFEQLQRFATQLSIRLFWLERAYPAVKPVPVVEVLPPLEEPAEPAPQSLSEVTLPDVPTWREKLSLSAVRQRWLPYVGVGFSGLLVVAAAVILLVRWRRRRLRQTVWLLPDYDHRHPVRFGGPHCGGCGSSVKYG